MDTLTLKGSNEIPKVLCDASQGVINIEGKSIPEDPYEEVFKPILNWVKEYANHSRGLMKVNIKLEYFNTSSSKHLLEVFRVLETIHHNIDDANVEINWYYDEDDEDMLEAGQDYEAMIKVPFNMKCLKN